MINERVQQAINKQINEEMYSSYLYLSMSTYLESINLSGFAHWLRLHAQEEMYHAMKLHFHLIERGGRVSLMEIKQPQISWDSVSRVFKDAREHEALMTRLINELMDLAIEEKDHAARNLLNWYVDEQVEEEATFDEMVSKLEMIGEQKGMLFMLDKEMGTRVAGFNPYDKSSLSE
jgi:ferritin